jgi:hypothetical protein
VNTFLLALLSWLLLGPVGAGAQLASFKIAKLKYEGGGDWYANPSSLPNLFAFIRQHTRANLYLEEEVVEPGSSQIFQYPMIYMTGHGNVAFTDAEAANLRKYLLAGGFFLMDDNYGLYPYITREMKKVFPEYDFQEIPFTHPVYHQQFEFAQGIPKIHEHDGKPPQLFGILHEGRLLCLLTYEADLGDGWEDPEVHHNPEELRLKALQMGTNIVLYVLNH